MTDKELCERLRAEEHWAIERSEAELKREAADRIEAQAREIERLTARVAELEAREARLREGDSYAAWQQKRGMLADTVDWAVIEYDQFMLDDAYDSQRVLDRIVERLRQTRAALETKHD